VQQGAAYITGDQRELKWALGDPSERSIDVAEKPLGKPGALSLVPSRGIVEIGFGE
jgi:hypothetical protein